MNAKAKKHLKKSRRNSNAVEVDDLEHSGIVGTVVDTGRFPALKLEQPRGVPERFVAIDRAALLTERLVPETAQARRSADQYRHIKRPLLNRIKGLQAEGHADAQLIMMASALPGDGKTFTSLNLAFSIAREKDSSVLLVDGDVLKPHISHVFGVENEPGLMDALAEERLDAESLVLATDIPGFSLLPAGRQHESATELLASKRMAAVATQLAQNNPRRILLFDSPPLLLSSESRALSAVMRHVVLVVRAGGTPRQAVLDAVECLRDKENVDVIFNQSQLAVMHGSYGYGDYGGYGRGTSVGMEDTVGTPAGKAWQ